MRRTAPVPRRARVAVRCALALLACALGACATIEHGMKTGEVAGRTLSTRSSLGADRLRAESEIDATVRDFVARHGRPDYIHVVDRERLYLFYVSKDDAALFQRELLPPSKVNDLGRIPGSLLRLLPQSEVKRILARRQAIQRKHEARAATRRRRARRSSPAAPAPRGGLVRAFDVDAIVARMRPPLTAADPGVSGWRDVRFGDGVVGGAAQVGSTRYEVRPDRVVVAVRVSTRYRAAPASARLAISRANHAIFGAQAEQINEHVMGLADRVVADTSGRTRYAQRIRGRTVRIDRVSAQGLLVYGVYP